MKTLVLGATSNPGRYAFTAVHRLKANGHEVVPVGIKKDEVAGLRIINDKPPLDGIDTVTLYVGPHNQAEWIDYILSLKPRRIIFNPGTNNPEFITKAKEQGIETIQACTLVMLASGTY
ncbi:MAG: CoA-binding protein [Bacteroidia bacterium]